METVGVSQVASAAGVTSATVRRWIKDGDMQAFQFPPGRGEFRIRGSEVARVCLALGRLVPEWASADGGKEVSGPFEDVPFPGLDRAG